MAIDQTSLGTLVSEQMQAIESDTDISEFAELGTIVCIVEVVDPGQEVESDEDVPITAHVRFRTNAPTASAAIGLLSIAKKAMLDAGYTG